MALKNSQLTISTTAWDVSSSLTSRLTGDAANITAYVALDDGNFSASTNSVAEKTQGGGGTGIYELTLTSAEMAADTVTVFLTSSTSNAIVETVVITTQVNNAGAGANTVTITVNDENTNPVPDVSVVVRDSGDNTTFASGDTDANGQISFNLDDATYAVRLQKLGYVADNIPDTLVVSGDTTDTMTMTAVSPSTPSGTNQTLYGYIYDPDGTYAEGASVVAQIVTLPQIVSGAVISKQQLSDTVDSSGYFELAILQGAVVNIKATDTDENEILSENITITTDSTRDLADYIS